jgi:hypothetical protein
MFPIFQKSQNFKCEFSKCILSLDISRGITLNPSKMPSFSFGHDCHSKNSNDLQKKRKCCGI